VGDRYYALAALAEERRLGELEATKGAINREFAGGYQVKNIGGRLIADMAMPAVSKIVKTYWEIEDVRLALLTRLKASAGPPKKRHRGCRAPLPSRFNCSQPAARDRVHRHFEDDDRIRFGASASASRTNSAGAISEMIS